MSAEKLGMKASIHALAGKATTPWLKVGDRIRIDMLDANGASIFGAIDNAVAQG